VNDSVLERIWEARDAIAKRAGYDAKTLVAELRKPETIAKRADLNVNRL
jgi:hypothetical protein